MPGLLLLVCCLVPPEIFPVTGRYARPSETVPTERTASNSARAIGAVSDYYVVVFTSQTCSPCQRMKRDTVPALQSAGVPVTLHSTDRDRMAPSWNVSSVPTTWIVSRQTRKPVWRRVGYVTASTVMAAMPVASRPLREQHAEQHLRQVHGIETSGLPFAELERLHDAEHIRESGGVSGNWHFPGEVSVQ